MISFIAFATLFLAIAFAIVAFMGKPKPAWFWAAALAMYMFSFLGSFSIGLYTLVIVFCLLALAIAHSFHWIKSRTHSVSTVAAAIFAWAISIKYVDDYWLFYPFHWVLRNVSS